MSSETVAMIAKRSIALVEQLEANLNRIAVLEQASLISKDTDTDYSDTLELADELITDCENMANGFRDIERYQRERSGDKQ